MAKLKRPKMERFTFKDFEAMFPNDIACLEWLRNFLHPNGIFCKMCDEIRPHHRVVSRPSYSCDYCGHHVHPTAGTIFHKSSTSLKTWFHAIYLMASTRCGISAKQIERETGVTYKTAWRMFKQIRSMLCDERGQLSGHVEMDETYMGGKRKGVRGRPPAGEMKKRCVVGAVERKGRVIALVANDATRATLHGIAKEHILPKSTVFTDELSSYDGLNKINGYRHRRINHSAGVYVVGNIHTNTIDGFWSLVKRGLGGVYHAVGANYLQTYLNEYSFRYNHRDDRQAMFTSFLCRILTVESPDSPSLKPVQSLGE